MTTFGWIVFSVFTLFFGYFAYQLTKDILWNHRLKKFQKNLGEVIVKRPMMFWIKRSYGTAMTSLFVCATLFSGAFTIPDMLGDRVLLNARSFSSEDEIKELINSQNYQLNQGWFNDFSNLEGAPETDMQLDGKSDDESADRDFIGTNNQVEGVEEADIIKTDGNTIYYAARYQNIIHILSVGDDGTATLLDDLELGSVYTDAIYLTDDYLIVIGYSYEMAPYIYDDTKDYIGWYVTAYTGTVIIYDRITLDIIYQLETDGNFYEYRLIDNALFLIANKPLANDEFRPLIKETKGENDVTTSYLGYEDIYYFEGIPIYGMSVFTGIDLDNSFNVTSQAFLGYINYIYTDQDSLYTAFSYYSDNSYIEADMFSSDKTQIMKFELDKEDATINYVGQTIILGSVHSQYWMDEYEGHLRVVTTSWNPIKNRLYVLKQSQTTDELSTVGLLDQGLGKPDERVYSVDFQKTVGYVVTFLQTDPRYMIDLSNPKDPQIIQTVERPGFSTYMHIWNDEGTQNVGFGNLGDENGSITGLELIAFNDSLGIEDSYVIPFEDEIRGWSYSFSQALYNPKAMMISPEHGIFAFPLNSWTYEEVSPDQYQSIYTSQYLVFYIDFTKEDPNDIISEPIVISHEASEYYFGIDRGIYIKDDNEQGFEMIYTFSALGMVSYDLQDQQINQSLSFDLPDWK